MNALNCISSDTQAIKSFAKNFDFKDIKFHVKIRDIHNKRILLALVILVMTIRRNIQFMYEKNVMN